MNSQALPSQGGGGGSGGGATNSGQAPPQQQGTAPKAGPEKKQETAKVIVQPVHPPLATLPFFTRQTESPQPPMTTIESVIPTVIKSSIPSFKHQTVPALASSAPSKAATPPSATIPATSTVVPAAALVTKAPPVLPSSHPQSTAPVVSRIQTPVITQTLPSTTSSQISTTTVSSVAPTRAPAPVTGTSGVPGGVQAGVPTHYTCIPSVQKLPPNSLSGEAVHTKAVTMPTPHLPPGTVTHSIVPGSMPYLSGLQFAPGSHQFSAQQLRGAATATVGLTSTKPGITTALLTRAGVPQGAVATTTSFPQQPVYGYPRHHAPGQVHLLTQRASSPGVLASGAVARAPSPAAILPTSQPQPQAVPETLRLIPQMIPSSQGTKPDGSAQAKVELKMVIKKDTKTDAVAKGDGKTDSRPSSRTESFLERSGDGSKRDSKAGEERVAGVKLAVATVGKVGQGMEVKGDRLEEGGARLTEAKVEIRSEGRMEMRVDGKPVRTELTPQQQQPHQQQRPSWQPRQAFIVGKEWPGIPPAGAAHAAGGLPGHMMPQVMTSMGGVLQTASPTPGVPQSSAHPIVRATIPPTSTATAAPSQPIASSAGTIPVAKVYPRQQQITTAPRIPGPAGLGPEHTAAYIQMHRSSPGVSSSTAASSLPSTLASTFAQAQLATATASSEVKMERPPPGVALSYFYHHDQIAYHPHVGMQQFQGRHGFNPIPTTTIRPALDGQHRMPIHAGPSLGQNSSMAAAVAAAAHATNIGGAPGRPGQLTMMVGTDPRRPIGLQGNAAGGVPSTSLGEGSADGSIPAFSMAQVPPTAMGLATGQATPPSVTNASASPRPSILRKRNNEVAGVRKPVMASAVTSRPGSPGIKVEITRIPVTTNSPKPSDCLPSSQNSENSNASETSTDTAPLSTGSGSMRIKLESDTNGLDLSTSLATSGLGLAHENSVGSLAPSVGSTEEVGPSPRKKPRKQQHIIASEHPMMLEDQSTDDEKETKQKVPFKVHKKEKKEKKNAAKAAAAAAAAAASAEAEALKVVQFFKRPCPRLVDTYRQSWKPAHNHFERYSDVKPKDEKKIGIHEIANQRGILKKADGWKIHHIVYQFDDLNSLEKDVYDQMKMIKEGLVGTASKLKEAETDKISELVQGSLQRSQYVMEHLEEAKGTILKMLDHKTKVAGIVKKHANKRHVKKKHSP
ncbi:uncharacterized protein [Diadema antillarum]|uniref:uncharacterized protein n=1 Tax=Diadema antillarum TaxID=105358 RepID=UPI003A889BC3